MVGVVVQPFVSPYTLSFSQLHLPPKTSHSTQNEFSSKLIDKNWKWVLNLLQSSPLVVSDINDLAEIPHLDRPQRTEIECSQSRCSLWLEITKWIYEHVPKIQVCVSYKTSNKHFSLIHLSFFVYFWFLNVWLVNNSWLFKFFQNLFQNTPQLNYNF